VPPPLSSFLFKAVALLFKVKGLLRLDSSRPSKGMRCCYSVKVVFLGLLQLKRKHTPNALLCSAKDDSKHGNAGKGQVFCFCPCFDAFNRQQQPAAKYSSWPPCFRDALLPLRS